LILFTATFLDKHNCTSGTPALTSRGFVEEDFAKVADFFDAAVKLAVEIKAETKGLYLSNIFVAFSQSFFTSRYCSW
jgi:glycine hydroxymethyltransferase